MGRREKQILLVVVGAGLIVGGHRLMEAEFGKLGVPHAVGAAVIALALRV